MSAVASSPSARAVGQTLISCAAAQSALAPGADHAGMHIDCTGASKAEAVQAIQAVLKAVQAEEGETSAVFAAAGTSQQVAEAPAVGASVEHSGIRVTPGIVEALGVAALLLLFVCVGLQALLGIASPSRIVQADLPVGREK